MEYLKVDKAFADKWNKTHSSDGSFMIEFTELKDGSFIAPIEVKEVLSTYIKDLETEILAKEVDKSIVSITDEKIASSKNGVKRPKAILTPL